MEFDRKTSNWDGWSEKFMAHGKRKGHKKLLQGKEQIPTSVAHELAVVENSNEDKKVEEG